MTEGITHKLWTDNLPILCNQSSLINSLYLMITAEQDWESAHQLQWMYFLNATFCDFVPLTGCYVHHSRYKSVVGQLIALRIFKLKKKWGKNGHSRSKLWLPSHRLSLKKEFQIYFLYSIYEYKYTEHIQIL